MNEGRGPLCVECGAPIRVEVDLHLCDRCEAGRSLSSTEEAAMSGDSHEHGPDCAWHFEQGGEPECLDGFAYQPLRVRPCPYSASPHAHVGDYCEPGYEAGYVEPLPIHRTEAGYPSCSTCDGGGCLDCTDPA